MSVYGVRYLRWFGRSYSKNYLFLNAQTCSDVPVCILCRWNSKSNAYIYYSCFVRRSIIEFGLVFIVCVTFFDFFDKCLLSSINLNGFGKLPLFLFFPFAFILFLFIFVIFVRWEFFEYTQIAKHCYRSIEMWFRIIVQFVRELDAFVRHGSRGQTSPRYLATGKKEQQIWIKIELSLKKNTMCYVTRTN